MTPVPIQPIFVSPGAKFMTFSRVARTLCLCRRRRVAKGLRTQGRNAFRSPSNQIISRRWSGNIPNLCWATQSYIHHERRATREGILAVAVSFSICKGKVEIRDSRFEIRESTFEIRDSRFERREARGEKWNVYSEARSLISALESRISSFVFRLSSFAFRLSPFVFRLSSFVFRLSSFVFRLSSFVFRLSSFVFRLSSFESRFPCESRKRKWHSSRSLFKGDRKPEAAEIHRFGGNSRRKRLRETS